VISASAEAAIAELNEIVRADGAELRLADASPSSIRLELDLSESTCTECVVTKELLLEILPRSTRTSSRSSCTTRARARWTSSILDDSAASAREGKREALRGVLRPGLISEENEQSTTPPRGCSAGRRGERAHDHIANRHTAKILALVPSVRYARPAGVELFGGPSGWGSPQNYLRGWRLMPHIARGVTISPRK